MTKKNIKKEVLAICKKHSFPEDSEQSQEFILTVVSEYIGERSVSYGEVIEIERVVTEYLKENTPITDPTLKTCNNTGCNYCNTLKNGLCIEDIPF